MTILDHLFIILFAVVHPAVGFISFRRVVRRINAGETISRNNMYFQTIAVQWLLFIAGVAIWAHSSRPWSAIGFRFDLDWRFALGAGLTVVCAVALLLQARQIRVADANSVQKLVDKLGHLTTLIPRTSNELALFNGVSVTAGIVEEFLWRGVLIWYLSQYLPLWAAAVISTIGFAAGHSYQGLAHLPGVLVIGTVLAGLYLLTGSIALPIVLHILVDILQGRGLCELMRRNNMATA
jgi:membrane protease YdiL (CAAX protease family)